jgi:L-ascorbate metabolism protein UlaG (beta-lactamase superfamily)
MEVTWLGGACFRLRGRDAAIATDPHTAGITQRSALPKADVVTLSRPLADGSPERLARANQPGRHPFVADGPGEYEVAGVYVHGVAGGGDGEAITFYAVDVDRLTVGYFARLTAGPSDSLLDELGAVHVLLVNVDGEPGALPPPRILQLVNRIEPNIVVPFGTGNGGSRSQSPAWRRAAQELSSAEPSSQSAVSVTRANLPEPVTVCMLEPRHK